MSLKELIDASEQTDCAAQWPYFYATLQSVLKRRAADLPEDVRCPLVHSSAEC